MSHGEVNTTQQTIKGTYYVPSTIQTDCLPEITVIWRGGHVYKT